MPPKRKAEVEEEPAILLPPRLTVADLQETWDDSRTGEYFSRILVDEIVGEVDQEIVRAHMDHTAVPWTVQSVVTDLMESLQLNFIEREPDEVGPMDVADVETVIDEPLTTDPDSWARASILQRSALVKPDSEIFNKAAAPAVKGAGRPLSQQSDRGRERSIAVPLDGSPFGGTVGGLPTLLGATSSTRPRDNLTSSRRRSLGDGRQASQRSLGSHQSLQDDFIHTVEEERLLERQKKAAERMAHLRGISERLNKQFYDVRNSAAPIVVDGATNQVLLVSRPDPNRLPASVEPKVNLPQEKEPSPMVSPRARGRGVVSPGGSSPYRSPNAKPPKPRKPDPQAFWEPEQQSNPMVVGVTPAPGVASKEGDVTKRSEMKSQKSKITKGEYSKIVTAQATHRHAVAELESANGGVQPSTSEQTTPAQVAAAAKSRKSTIAGSKEAGVSITTPEGPHGGGVLRSGGLRPSSPIKMVAADPSKKREVKPATLPQRVIAERAPTPSRAARKNPARIASRSGTDTPPMTISEIAHRARATTPSSHFSRPGSRQSGEAAGHVSVVDISTVEDDVTREFLMSVERDAREPHSPASQSSLTF